MIRKWTACFPFALPLACGAKNIDLLFLNMLRKGSVKLKKEWIAPKNEEERGNQF